jgi:hypothetical protein
VTAPSNLDCILLKACVAAYDIAPGTCTYTPDTINSPNVPYTNGPQPACGGPCYINAATVGLTETTFPWATCFRNEDASGD